MKIFHVGLRRFHRKGASFSHGHPPTPSPVLEEPPPGIFSKTPDRRTPPPPLSAQSPHDCKALFTVKRIEAPFRRKRLAPINSVNRSASCSENLVVPKGPFRTKNTTESEFRYGEKIRYGRSKTLRRGLRNACLSRKKEAGKRYRK